MVPMAEKIRKLNRTLRSNAVVCRKHLAKDHSPHAASFITSQQEVNEGGKILNDFVKGEAVRLLGQGKLVGVLGGDHSAPLGLLRALADHSPGFSILHIDAHFDLRLAFEGFIYSHASIMRNATEIRGIDRFIHVGVRDYCEEESKLVAKSLGRHVVFTDRDIRRRLFQGEPWSSVVDRIVRTIPKNPVYVSFDIDGLDPLLCPNTGTPVPGGFNLEEIFYLLFRLGESERKIIGFDLCEVAPGSKDWASDWNANVGMRVLYRLSMLASKSCGKKLYC